MSLLNSGFPLWLHFIPGVEFRTDNEPFKVHKSLLLFEFLNIFSILQYSFLTYLFQAEMKRFTAKIVDLMKQEKLYASQGGPIILSQVENFP